MLIISFSRCGASYAGRRDAIARAHADFVRMPRAMPRSRCYAIALKDLPRRAFSCRRARRYAFCRADDARHYATLLITPFSPLRHFIDYFLLMLFHYAILPLRPHTPLRRFHYFRFRLMITLSPPYFIAADFRRCYCCRLHCIGFRY